MINREGPAGKTELPRYQCHKIVWALKIADIERDLEEGGLGGSIITPTDAAYAPFRVPREYVQRHEPEPGGYYVVYADGYRSYSPAEAFEAGYVALRPTRGGVLGEDIERWFTYHPPKGDQAARYQLIRDKAKELAHMIGVFTPGCADQMAALRKLRECVMTANAAIACEE